MIETIESITTHLPVITDVVPSVRVTRADTRFQYGDPTLSGFSCDDTELR